MILFFFRKERPAAGSSADGSVCRLFQGVEHLGTSFGNVGIWRFHARKRRPTALRDERVLFPRVDRLEFRQSRLGRGRMLEVIDADWREHRHNCVFGTLVRHFRGRISERPSAPSEADDDCCEKARDGSLYETR